MKQHISEFFRRGLVASGFGPLVLAVLYPILQHAGVLESLSAGQVSTGIFSLWALAFVAGGMNVVYQIEQLPLMVAILIHGGVLYVGYLAVYLLNSWLERGSAPILIFTGIFVLGYLAIWAVIFCITRQSTRKLNERLKEKQSRADEN